MCKGTETERLLLRGTAEALGERFCVRRQDWPGGLREQCEEEAGAARTGRDGWCQSAVGDGCGVDLSLSLDLGIIDGKKCLHIGSYAGKVRVHK